MASFLLRETTDQVSKALCFFAGARNWLSPPKVAYHACFDSSACETAVSAALFKQGQKGKLQTQGSVGTSMEPGTEPTVWVF